MKGRPSAYTMERWRVHREHCEAGKHGVPCWGPDTCLRCVEIGNAQLPAAAAVPLERGWRHARFQEPHAASPKDGTEQVGIGDRLMAECATCGEVIYPADRPGGYPSAVPLEAPKETEPPDDGLCHARPPVPNYVKQHGLPPGPVDPPQWCDRPRGHDGDHQHRTRWTRPGPRWPGGTTDHPQPTDETEGV